MVASYPRYQAVLLAGGDAISTKRLHPLTTGMTRALLPVGNKPLILYSLRTFLDAGVKHVIVVAIGDKVAASINAWLTSEYTDSHRMKCEVTVAPEDSGTADALRSVAHKIVADTFVVMSGDLVTDAPLQAVVTSHNVRGARATMVVTPRKTSPCMETKPGKAPKGVDYIGLDASRERLLFFASSPETLNNLRMASAMLSAAGSITIRTDLMDSHLYVFSRSVLKLLLEKAQLSTLKLDFMPALVREQLRGSSGDAGSSGGSGNDGALGRPRAGSDGLAPSPRQSMDNLLQHGAGAGLGWQSMSHSLGAGSSDSRLPQGAGPIQVYMLEADTYCQRVNSVQAYGDVNRDVAAPEVAQHLATPGKGEGFIPPSTTLGNKTTVGPACIVGERCALGDKASAKRSVVGNNCRLGANVKVINSVLMDSVVVGEGCHIQNSVLCVGCSVLPGATLKDCTVGQGYQVAGGVEYKGETMLVGKPAAK